MSLTIGIVGPPNVGKSTLFNALTKKQNAQASNFPFTTINPNIGIVDLPDNRLQKLAELVQPTRIVPATVTFVDIAGLVAGAHQGEGLGNKFLANIRDVDAIALVVRDFTDPDVVHVTGVVDPLEDIHILQTELALKDLETLEHALANLEGKIKARDPEATTLQSLLKRIKTEVEQGRGVRSIPLSQAESARLKSFRLLTAKAMLCVLNVSETKLDKTGERIKELIEAEPSLFASTPLVPISAKIEAELSTLNENEQIEYLASLGFKERGLDRLIREAFALLGLITYFTAGPKEVRAWTIQRDATAPQAAGVIHTDFERGFIKAEVISCADFLTYHGKDGAQSAGKLRQEGRDYVVADGDVIEFRFNV
ncbi:redox-regulated ATPase YchF [Candidatus Berkelbacteria bacterium]|nr:redox-regulated ATPase YchF [Candidatus Berkelbacteria bacterium]